MKLTRASVGYNHSAPILWDIDAELLHGQMVALIGRNGTGKSTLLRSMAGLQPLLSGSITGDHPSIVLTTPPDLQNTSVRQMVAYGRLPFTGFFGRLHLSDLEYADRALQTLGLSSMAQQQFCKLSDGEKQKVMIAHALAQGTSTLLLDEPSAFLDYPSRLQLMQQLSNLAHNQGKAILVSTHDLELAQRFADSFWLVKDHRLHTGIAPQSFKPDQL